jgi:hypothetical protein
VSSTFRPWPVDEKGRLLPATPVRGLRVEVHLGRRGGLFDRWRVTAASRTGFTAVLRHARERHAAADWGAWLDARCAEGTVSVHLPGCPLCWCSGCDGSGVGRPGSAVASGPPTPSSPSVVRSALPAAFPLAGGDPMASMNVAARDVRVLRAARDVLTKYRITRRSVAGADPNLRVFNVEGGGAPYIVSVDVDWQQAPTCTCPDHRRSGGFCKHAIGVLLKDDELRCQLLELFL